MLFIDNGGITDATYNLALEEYCLEQVPIDKSYLLFYVNKRAIIVGRHQNTAEEIDTDYVERHGVQVVRRISGGGAVYHDEGNLNFSFIRRYDKANFNDYAFFTRPVVEALHELGVPAEQSGRNDILVDGRKVSGNAQAVRRDRMFSHGTLLFRSELENVVSALRPKPGKLKSKGIRSIRSRVVNIGEFLPAEVSMADFREALLKHIFPGHDTPPTWALSAADLREVEQLADRKYRTWDWNYGRSPAFNLQRIQRYGIGEVDARLVVEQGVVQAVRFYGDFFSSRDIGELEQALTGVRYDATALKQALEAAHAGEFLQDVSVDELVKQLY